ncbi:hypothetical protein ACE6H2_013200 [Prunus campanulata]
MRKKWTTNQRRNTEKLPDYASSGWNVTAQLSKNNSAHSSLLTPHSSSMERYVESL